MAKRLSRRIPRLSRLRLGRQIWHVNLVKTTLELPDPLLRKAKATAASRGQSLKDFFTEALCEKLMPANGGPGASRRQWMRGFGRLRRLRAETARIQAAIDREFDAIGTEDRE